VTPGSGVLKPGEETTILVQMDTSRFTGSKTVSIFVSWGPHYGTARLWVQAKCVEEEVAPQAAPGTDLLATPARAGEDTHASLFKELMGILRYFTLVLKTVVDENTAKSALPVMKKIIERVTGITKRMETLGQPTEQLVEELKTKYEAEAVTIGKAWTQEMTRICRMPGGHITFDMIIGPYLELCNTLK
jgi:hypothetical protein